MIPRIFLLLTLAGLLSAHGMDSSPVVREQGAIYMSDLGDKPLKTEVLQAAPAYFHIQMQDFAGTLRAGQTVEITAISENGITYRVRGQAQQGQILGWVSPQYLHSLDPQFIANLKKAMERKKTVDALIAQNQVAIGMTPDEVQRSVGKPNKKTSKADQKGVLQIWEYVKYVSVPQQVTGRDPYGNLVTSTIYVKKPIGKLTINFTDSVVSSLEQSEGTILTGNEVQIVVPPVVVY
ncbi:MAG: hypothetical protein ABI443_09690 [Chthoniobacterales bacterium]